MTSDVKLLPLPEKDDDLPRSGMWNGHWREGSDPCWLQESVEAYALACVEAALAGQRVRILADPGEVAET